MSFEGRGENNANETGPTERITLAAIKYKGDIFTGRLHSDAWKIMTEKYPEAVMTKDREDGFMTSTGRFVSGEEALEIADNADQLQNEKHYSAGILSAEELKNEEEK